MEGLDLHIAQIAENAWKIFLGLPIQLKPEEASDDSRDADTVSGRIDVNGIWTGSVIVSCSLELARKTAAAMFREDVDAISEDQLIDALGEITNIVAGNLKGALPGPSELSLPVVSEAVEASQNDAGAGPRTHVAFDCDGEPLWICVSGSA